MNAWVSGTTNLLLLSSLSKINKLKKRAKEIQILRVKFQRWTAFTDNDKLTLNSRKG